MAILHGIDFLRDKYDHMIPANGIKIRLPERKRPERIEWHLAEEGYLTWEGRDPQGYLWAGIEGLHAYAAPQKWRLTLFDGTSFQLRIDKRARVFKSLESAKQAAEKKILTGV